MNQILGSSIINPCFLSVLDKLILAESGPFLFFLGRAELNSPGATSTVVTLPQPL